VEEDDDDEERAEHEERRRGVVDPDQACDRVEAASPEGEDEQDGGRQEPEEGVALAQAARPDQLEDDGEERDRDRRRDEGDAERRHASALTGSRKSPTKIATSTFVM
jgi:hypothetical protein